jgi:hypothetical protein
MGDSVALFPDNFVSDQHIPFVELHLKLFNFYMKRIGLCVSEVKLENWKIGEK